MSKTPNSLQLSAPGRAAVALPDHPPALNRRHAIAGAGVIGAAAAAAAMLPRSMQPAPEVQSAAQVPDRGGGYQVTEHVLHYYRTTRV